MNVEYLKLSGSEARAYISELAQLRIKVFHEFPYLYEGSLQYEEKYLETYFKAKHSFIMLVLANKNVVGATTGIWAQEEEASFKLPFASYGIDPKKVFYFGESVLENEYRNRGIGKIFFKEREAFARKLGFIDTLAFCAVERDDNHSLKPDGYRSLEPFWKSLGFIKEEGLVTTFEWKDRDSNVPTPKKMQFWIKRFT